MADFTPRAMPAHMQVGDVWKSGDKRIVRTVTGGAFVPDMVTELEAHAKRYGWGTLTEIYADSYGPVIVMSVGRNAGPTRGGRRAHGITFRLRWDTVRTGRFELVHIYQRSTRTHGDWVAFGKAYGVTKMIERNPVPLEIETLV